VIQGLRAVAENVRTIIQRKLSMLQPGETRENG